MSLLRFSGLLSGALLAAGCPSSSFMPAHDVGGHVEDAGWGSYDGTTLPPLHPNDVSILFPYPQSAEDALLRMTNSTPRGDRVLLTEPVFKLLGNQEANLPFLIESFLRDELYGRLRVVAARIDPCHDVHRPTAETTCRRQVRLVAQAYLEEGGILTDAAIHLFYELDDAAFVELLLGLRPARLGAAHDAPLGVHPALAEGGLDGPAAQTLRDALLEAVQEPRLFRFTFMATGRSGDNWFFHTLERQPDGAFRKRDDAFSHGGFTNFGSAEDRSPVPLMDPDFPDALLATTSLLALDEATLQAGIQQLLRLTSPRLLATSEVHCASCHAVDTTLKHALEVRSLSPSPVPVADLHHGFGNLHAFSYFDFQPSISLRTRAETQQVVEFLASEDFARSLSPEQRARLLE